MQSGLARVLLFTGKGGVGKTTTAAGTAALAADRGLKTLVLSTDPAHSLADTLGVPVGPDPGEVPGTGLFAQQVDPRQRFAQSWDEIQRYLLAVLDAAGVDPLAAEELTVLPGADEVLALLEVRDQVRSGRWDLVVVDCAPTGETLRLLALPEALDRYVARVFPVERRVVRALRPVLGRASGVPAPRDEVFEAVERLHLELIDVRDLLTAPTTSVRLVLTPEAVVVAEARRTLASLALHGYRVDGVVANRVVPAGGRDPWRNGWVTAQQGVLDDVETSFAPLRVQRAPYLTAEPVGVEALLELAGRLYDDGADDDSDSPDPLAFAAVRPGEELMTVERSGRDFVLELRLPLAERSELQLARRGDELIVTVGASSRVIVLPSGLRRCTVAGAGLRDGRLRVTFEPDPDLWRGHP